MFDEGAVRDALPVSFGFRVPTSLVRVLEVVREIDLSEAIGSNRSIRVWAEID